MSDDLTRCPCCEGEGYFYGDETPPCPWGDADEIARLRAALADEREHADALAGALEEIRESFSEVANQWGDPFEDECGTWAKYVSAAIGELHSAIVKALPRARCQG